MVDGDGEKLKSLYFVSGTKKWYSHWIKTLSVELSCDPAISLLGIHPKSLTTGPQTHEQA